MSKKLTSALIVVVSASLMLSACTTDASPAASSQGGIQTGEFGFAVNTGEAKSGGTVNVLSAVDLSHLDPAMGNDGDIRNFYRLIYRTLTTYSNEPGEGTTVVPDLATDTGTPNESATEWTFTLKDDIFYEDGTPITSGDIKYAIERSFDPAVGIGQSYHRVYLQGGDTYRGVYEDPSGLDSIKTPDDKTIIFHLNQPLPGFPNLTATSPFAPVPKDGAVSTTQLDQAPIASGPYKVESYKRGSSLTLVRNEFWSSKTDSVRPAYPDRYAFTFGLDPVTISQRIIAGQGDDKNAMTSSTSPLQASNLSEIQKDEYKERTVRDTPACVLYLALNTTHEPFNDMRVRQAVNFAVNKKSVQNATGGPMMASITDDMLLPDVPGREAFNLYETDDHAGDIDKAKKLLAAAGYENGFAVTMDVRGIPKWQAQAVAVQESLKRVGIDLTLNVIDAAKYYEVIGSPTQQAAMGITGRCSSWLSGVMILGPLFDGDQITDKGNLNVAQLNDPTINERFDQIMAMTDVDEQNAEFAKLNREIMKLAPVVPLLWETSLQMVGSNLGNAFAHSGLTGYIDYTSVGLKDPEN